MHLLLIEDDAQAARYISKGLRECGHVVDEVHDGGAGLDFALNGEYDVIIADRMLPVCDGLSIIKTLRSQGDVTPVLILSALGEVNDRVDGLSAGGDDYLVKPYAFSELRARIDALARRNMANPNEAKLKVADLEIDLHKHRVTRAGELIRLQPREYRLLEYFMRHADQVVTRSMLLEQVWEFNFDPQTNVIDVQISRLRAKIDKGHSLPLLHTIRGAGYKLSVEEPI